MLNEKSIGLNNVVEYVAGDRNCYKIKRLYNSDNVLSVVQILDSKNMIHKCIFYDDIGRVSSVAVYNSDTGKEIKNITYRADGKTVSSIREFEPDTGRLLCVTFYKEDGVSVSSTIEYNEYGDEAYFSLFCDDGEVIRQSI